MNRSMQRDTITSDPPRLAMTAVEGGAGPSTVCLGVFHDISIQAPAQVILTCSVEEL